MSNSAINAILNETTDFESSSIYANSFYAKKKKEALGRGLNNMLGNNGKNGTGTQFENGMPSPRATPGVEDGRVDTDKARQAAQGTEVTEEQEAARSVLDRIEDEKQRRATETAKNAEVGKNNPNDDQEMGEASDGEDNDSEDNDSDYEPGAGDVDPEEIRERARVMSCSSKNYREILGIEEAYNTLKEERTAVLAACRNLGTLIHPDYSNDENAEVAFKSK
jgi:hypothetical protein